MGHLNFSPTNIGLPQGFNFNFPTSISVTFTWAPSPSPLGCQITGLEISSKPSLGSRLLLLSSVFLFRKYYVKELYKVIQKSDPGNGDRFLLDLELGLMHDPLNRSIRFAQHVYQRNGSDILCHPEGMNWNSSATVYFIVAVKDQGLWVQHFIKQLTIASLLTGDTNFHVIIADFQSKDINMSEAFSTSLLRSRHTIINLMGKFYRTLALNKAAEAVPNAHDILFVFDLHIDVPADIMDSVRKVVINYRSIH